MENGTCDGSAERLNKFWEYVSESSFDLMPGVIAWWDYLHNNFQVYEVFSPGLI